MDACAKAADFKPPGGKTCGNAADERGGRAGLRSLRGKLAERDAHSSEAVGDDLRGAVRRGGSGGGNVERDRGA